MLIVDDKEINRAILASYFRDEFNILQAEDGQETLDYVYSQPVDIIMLDLVVPKMSGMEVLDKLKTNPRYSDIPVIVTTSINDTSSEAFSMERGAADYITKPYNPIIVRCRVFNNKFPFLQVQNLIAKQKCPLIMPSLGTLKGHF